MRTPARAAVLALLCLALGAPGAYAQDEDGVHVDPDSPSGQEYEIPLESARRGAASGDSTGGSSSADSPPLFGDGVGTPEPASGSSGGDESGGSSGGGDRDRSQDREGKRPSERDAAQVKIAAGAPAAPDGGIGTSLLIAAISAVVLLLGAGLGVALRRGAGR